MREVERGIHLKHLHDDLQIMHQFAEANNQGKMRHLVFKMVEPVSKTPKSFTIENKQPSTTPVVDKRLH